MDSGKTVITGAVLRTTDTKEADKILTVLTQHEGKVTVRARGALRKGIVVKNKLVNLIVK